MIDSQLTRKSFYRVNLKDIHTIWIICSGLYMCNSDILHHKNTNTAKILSYTEDSQKMLPVKMSNEGQHSNIFSYVKS
jgi:hypothetical protein